MIDIQNTRNTTRILTVALGECQRQQTDFRGLVDLLSAYEVAEFNQQRGITEVLILRLGQLIDPVANAHGYRQTPVTFQNGRSGVNPQLIPDTMGRFFHLLNLCTEEDQMHSDMVDAFVKHFLDIHPFRDGNGRCAWILYNWLRGTLDYPLPLPEYEF